MHQYFIYKRLKKIVQLIILQVLFLNICFAQFQPLNPLYEKQIMKKNKVLTQSKWKYRPNATEGVKVLSKTFDNNGNVIEEMNYKPDGSRSSRLTYKYDNNENKIYYQLFDFSQVPEKRVRYVQNMVYNQNNDRISETGFDGISDFEIEYKYLAPGKLSEIIKYNDKKEITEKRKYTYGSNTITMNVYNSAGTIKEIVEEKYDATGNLLEKTTLKPDETVIKKNIYKYDNTNRLIEEEEYFGTNFSSKLSYIYNDIGYVKEIEKEESSGNIFTNNSYNYDVKGNLIEELWYDGNPDDYSKKTYNYDEKDNVKEVDSYYSLYRYKVLYKYTYEFY